MVHLYNIDTQKLKKVHRTELYGTLLELQEQGAIFSLDIDYDITYSFEDGFEGETIEVLLEKVNEH